MTQMTSSTKWWCYLHFQGYILTKRFMIEHDGRTSIDNAKQEMEEGNGTVLAVLDTPVEAPDQQTAQEYCSRLLIEQLAAQGLEIRERAEHLLGHPNPYKEVYLWKNPAFGRKPHRFDNLELE